jgi:hypothetical protein
VIVAPPPALSAHELSEIKVGKMKKKLVVALVPFLALGCSEELVDDNKDGIADGVNKPGGVTVVAPATPMGTVSGQVLTSKYTPLDGVEVSMTIGSSATAVKATTDVAGNFTFKDVPAGARVLLTFSKTGFVTARSWALVPSEAGNVPINNGNASFGPAVMAETNGSVKFQVFTAKGRPATGAKATLTVNNAAFLLGNSSESIEGRITVNAEVDAQGGLSFSGIPHPVEGARMSSGYVLHIEPMDTNGDSIPDVDGYATEYSASTLLTGNDNGVYDALTIRLEDSIKEASLAIKHASIANLENGDAKPVHNAVRSGETITVAFNQPILPASLVVGLTDEFGRENMTVNKALAASNTFLTITPGALTAGREYNLYLRAVALKDGSFIEKRVEFAAGDVSAAPTAVSVTGVRFEDNGTTGFPPNNQLDSGETVYVELNQLLTQSQMSDSVEAYFNVDLGPAGVTPRVIGDYYGEKGYKGDGFPVTVSQPSKPNPLRSDLAVFPLPNGSGYASQLSFSFSGSPPNPLFANSLPEITLKFSKWGSFDAHYHTAWGAPVVADIVIPQGAATTYTPDLSN